MVYTAQTHRFPTFFISNLNMSCQIHWIRTCYVYCTEHIVAQSFLIDSQHGHRSFEGLHWENPCWGHQASADGVDGLDGLPGADGLVHATSTSKQHSGDSICHIQDSRGQKSTAGKHVLCQRKLFLYIMFLYKMIYE